MILLKSLFTPDHMITRIVRRTTCPPPLTIALHSSSSSCSFQAIFSVYGILCIKKLLSRLKPRKRRHSSHKPEMNFSLYLTQLRHLISIFFKTCVSCASLLWYLHWDYFIFLWIWCYLCLANWICASLNPNQLSHLVSIAFKSCSGSASLVFGF